MIQKEQIYEAFKIGFSDYSVPINFEIDSFFERFFGLEGNKLEHSVIAIEDDEPIGLILGGIRQFDGYKNMRCGTLCVSPKHRGSGVSGKLFDFFLDNAVKNKCERLSLEVLSHNKRAIRFYEKRGFEKKNKLLYYSANTPDVLNCLALNDNIRIVETDCLTAIKLRDEISNLHINWQNETDYFSLDKEARCFAAYNKDNLVGTLVITTSGKIYNLFVVEKYRRKMVASSLLNFSICQLKPENLSIGMSDNIDMRDFLMKLNFVKEEVEQYEMFRLLDRHE